MTKVYAKNEYKTWGEMTPEEKGELLLAHHEGKIIEWKYFQDGDFHKDSTRYRPVWDNTYFYRVKPELKVESMEIRGKPKGTFWQKGVWDSNDKHKITFDLVDGEPDWSTLKGETL